MSDLFPRTVLIHGGDTQRFKGEWVAIPREDFDTIRGRCEAALDFMESQLRIATFRAEAAEIALSKWVPA